MLICVCIYEFPHRQHGPTKIGNRVPIYMISHFRRLLLIPLEELESRICMFDFSAHQLFRYYEHLLFPFIMRLEVLYSENYCYMRHGVTW
jgi:hypothetical protein